MPRDTFDSAVALLRMAVVVVFSVYLPYCPADEPILRSLRQPQHNPVDELDWPQYHERTSQLGWEVRTRHFTVTSSTGPAQARWLAEQLEATWQELFPLADYWTSAHRQPTFAISSVGVMVTNEHPDRYAPQPGGPRPLNDEPNIYISLAPKQPSLQQQLPQIRREAVRSFFRITDLDQTLPEWVQTGLADYYASPPYTRPSPPFAATSSPSPASQAKGSSSIQPLVQEFGSSVANSHSTDAANLGSDVRPAPTPDQTPLVTGALPVFEATPPARIAPDRVRPSDDDRRLASLWTRYFLEADDAQHAPLLMAALAQDVAYRSAERLHWAAVSQGVWRPPLFPDRFSQDWQPSHLLGISHADIRLSEWRAAPLSGQPILDTSQLESAELARLAADMTLILKLARRFDDSELRVLRPDVAIFDANQTPVEPHAADENKSEAVARGLDLARLYRRLTDPSRSAWATLDVDGRLLWWNNNQRLANLFDNSQRPVRSYSDNGRDVLQCATGSGRLLEVWLEDNPRNATRPRAIARTRSAWDIANSTDTPPEAP